MIGSGTDRLIRSVGALLLVAVMAMGAALLPRGAMAHGDPHPAHIHVGDCSAPGDVVAPLEDVTYPDGEGSIAWSMSSVELSIEDILAEPHSIVLHESADNMSNYVLCGDIEGDAMGEGLTVALGELNGSGKAGVATLTTGDMGTEVTVIALEDATAAGMIDHDAEVAHPSHIHNGACPAPGDVVFPLTDFTASGSAESSMTDLDTTIADIVAAEHAIVVHASGDDMGTYIACGDITGEPMDGTLAVQLGELNDSGHVGVAILMDGDAGVTVHAYLVPGAAGDMMMDDHDMMGSPEADDMDSDDMESDDMGAMDGDEVAATIEDFAFVPGEIEVKVGTTITWTNNDSVPHTVTARDDSFDSGRMEQGNTFSFTFDTAGSFEYFCEYHPNMVGTIVVTE